MWLKNNVVVYFTLTLITLLLARPVLVNAVTVDQLQSQINDKQAQIKQLEADIAKYQSEVGKTQSEAQTLKTTISQLDAIRKKLQTDIAITSARIDEINSTISLLSMNIDKTRESISTQQDGLESIIRSTYRNQLRSPVEVFFSNQTLSEAWNELSSLSTTQEGMSKYVQQLRASQSALENQQNQKETQKKSLLSLSDQLSDQKQITEQNRQSKNKLLAVTKNKEQAYNKMIADRLALKTKVEAELFDYESRLKVALDASRLPDIGSGVLAWPLDSVRITQQFGNTAFSRANALSYAGQGHNGIDLAAMIGTPVYAAKAGKVLGTGNTDLGCPGAAYGKWILIVHENGLATMYGHLSLIKVEANQTVGDKELIGYSGNTGFVTGPHLHFTVMASQGAAVAVPIHKNGRPSSCGLMPVSPLNGYQNPLLYLESR